MASINKMSIQGIRSFDPQQAQIISFDKPLTVIVGPNGSGKTTIIECLRYATTGDHPHGQLATFVHNPQLAGARQVKAKVTLQFTNVQGQNVTSTRMLDVSIDAAKKLKASTVDNSMELLNANGERVSISNRCADFDQEMVRHLGVSKAILANVIFCHQEDSLWPLWESSKLKPIFDDIFAASRYSAALDQIKEVQKQCAEKLREAEFRLETAKGTCDEARQRRMQATEVRARIEASEGDRQTIQTQITKADETLRRLSEELATIDAIDKERQTKRDLRQVKVDQATALQRQLGDEQFQESEEELRVLQAQLATQLAGQDRMTAAAGDQVRQHRQDLDIVRRQLQETVAKQGGLDERLNTYQASSTRRDQSTASLNAALGLGVDLGPTPLTAEAVARFRARLAERQRELEAHVAEIKTEYDRELARVNAEVQRLQGLGNSGAGTYKAMESQMTQRLQQLAALTKQVAELAVTQADVDRALAERHAADEALAAFQKMHSVAVAEAELKGLRTEQTTLEARWAELMKQRERLSAQGHVRARLDQLEAERTDRRNVRQALIDEHGAALQAKAMTVVTLDNFVALAQASHREARAQLDAAREASAAREVELARAQSRLDSSTQQLQAARRQREDLLTRHPELRDVGDINIRITQLERQLTDEQSNVAVFNAMASIYGRFMTTAQSTHKCPVCDRGFAQDAEHQHFEAQARQTLARIPDLRQVSDRSITDLTQELQRLRALRDPASELARLQQTTLAGLEQDVERLTTDVELAQAAAAEARLAKAMNEAHFEAMSGIEGAAKRALEATDRIRRLDDDLARLRRDMAVQEADVTMDSNQRQLDDVQRRRQSLTSQIADVERELATMRTESLRLERKCAEEQQRVATQQQRLETKQTLEANRALLDAENTRARAELETLKQNQNQLKVQVAEAERQRTDMTQQGERRRRQATDELETFRDQARAFQSLQESLDRVDIAKLRRERTDADQAMAQLQEREAGLTRQVEEAEGQRHRATSRRTEMEQMNRRISDTLQFRQLQLEIRMLDQRLASLTSQIDASNRPRIVEDHRRHAADRASLVERINQFVGSINELRKQVQSLERELQTAKYRDADIEYRRLLIEKKTRALAIEDLAKYHRAVDGAIMSYHRLKMDEVNKIVAELWNETYDGSDIDNIKLTADEVRGVRRSYNYRVVMQKGAVELDMRDRCSAGQKVLTSIIIRLALAETFGLNCGVLALDEPTTNLDNEHVDRLAQALARIIEARRKQHNFQLIVITHDENFTRHLGDYVDHCWRVAKDNGQHSRIRKTAVSSS